MEANTQKNGKRRLMHRNALKGTPSMVHACQAWPCLKHSLCAYNMQFIHTHGPRAWLVRFEHC